MKQNPLLADLRVAFPPAPIFALNAFEQRGRLYCDVPDYVAALDNKTWEQLDPQFFARRSDALDFLGDTHLAAVLPLYLHLLIVFRPTSPVPETLLPLLTPPAHDDYKDTPTLFDWQRRRFDALIEFLTDAQKRVVARTLTQFVEDAPNEARLAQLALDRYWHTFA